MPASRMRACPLLGLELLNMARNAAAATIAVQMRVRAFVQEDVERFPRPRSRDDDHLVLGVAIAAEVFAIAHHAIARRQVPNRDRLEPLSRDTLCGL